MLDTRILVVGALAALPMLATAGQAKANCPSYTTTNDLHADTTPPRAEAKWRCWYRYCWIEFTAIGTGEELGSDPAEVTTLYEIEPGVFSLTDGQCEPPAADPCPATTDTAIEHVELGNAYVVPGECIFRWWCAPDQYYAIGSDELLGEEAFEVHTLYEVQPGVFSLDASQCAGGGGCEGYLCLERDPAPTIDELITRCPSPETIAAIHEDLDIRFLGDETADDPSVCTLEQDGIELSPLQERMYQALIALRHIGFSGLSLEPAYAQLGWGDADGSLYAWLVEQIAGIQVRTDIDFNSCCSTPPDASGNYLDLRGHRNSAALATPLWSTGDPLGLTVGLNSLVQLIVHEARHVAGPPHCSGGDDTSIDALGSWGAVYYFQRALAFNSDACYLQPIDGRPADEYLVAARSRAYVTQDVRFDECGSTPEPSPDPPEPVTACGP